MNYEIQKKFVFRIPTFHIDYSLEDAIKDPIFKEAIYLASKNLCQIIYDEQALSLNHLSKKLKNSFVKYYLRSKSRCTPFGIFAGCGTGTFAEKTNFIINEKSFRTKTRLDMEILFHISKKVSENPVLKDRILWISNNSILKIDNYSFRYIDYTLSDFKRKYALNTIKYDKYLNAIIEKTKHPTKIGQIIKLLENEGFNNEESISYIDQLITNQIIIPKDESFVVSNNEPIEVLLGRIEELQCQSSEVYTILNDVKRQLELLDTLNLGRNIDTYNSIENKISNLTQDYKTQHLFQTDTSLATIDGEIGSKILDAVKNGFSFLNKISNNYEDVMLEQFKNNFIKRYEDEEIPLLEALDIDYGIGFGDIDQGDYNINPLLDGINLNKRQTTNQSDFLSLISKKLEHHSFDEIVVTDEDISNFVENFNDLPYTLSSIVEVVQAGNTGNDPMIVMRNVSGPSAVKLISRFCQANPEINMLAQEIIFHEENAAADSNLLLAEIIHLPQTRTGNVLYHPRFRTYEIPYLTNSIGQIENIVDLSDLFISVKENKIFMMSKRLNKEIMPILSNAHNYYNDTLPVYKFLCCMQMQGKRNNLGFSWGIEEKPFSPRITYKNIIISPAAWNINKDEFRFNKLNTNFEEEVNKFIKKRKLPNKVYMCSGDNKLLIDFSDINSVEILFNEVKNKGVRVEEYLYNHSDMLIKDTKEHIYSNQLIFNFIRKKDNEFY